MKLRKNNKSVININVPPKIDQNQNQNQNPPQRLTHLTCKTLHSTTQYSLYFYFYFYFLFNTYVSLSLSLCASLFYFSHSLTVPPQMLNLNHTH